ncbi:hypothetical protein SVIOM342S_05577 [Streptomyces violaceorubidus]
MDGCRSGWRRAAGSCRVTARQPGARVYVPRGETLPVTGRALVLPEEARSGTSPDDLPGFPALVGGVPGRWKGSLP